MNAYGYIKTKIVTYKTLQCYIKNWGWKENGDTSGLEVLTFNFESIFKD